MGAPEHDEDLARGRTLGRYVVLDRLGRGAMGSVYAAYDPELARRVALKVLRPSAVLRQGHEAARQRLVREAQALARLAHPHVVRVFDVGVDEGRVFVAMELVEGQSLRRWLDAPHRWREVVEVLEQAGRGLAAAHALGLVHRDVKPDNVLVATDGRVRVGDFGLVRRIDDARPEPRDELGRAGEGEDAAGLRTAAGDVLGTPAYMAPEQHTGGEAGPCADQYAFCVTLFEALYGRRPFAPEDDRAALLQAKRRGLGDEAGARGVMDRVPASVRAVLRRGLSVMPADRFPTMEALLAALARARTRAGAWRASAVVGLVVLAGLGLAAVRPEPTETPCAGAGAAPSAAWDVASRDAVRQRLGGYAPAEDVERMVETLDARVAAWADAARDACEDTWVRGEQSLARQRAREECLHAQWVELEETVALLQQGEADVAAKASALVLGLAAPSACADVRPPARAGGAAMAATEGGTAGPTPADVRRRLGRVAVLRRAGRLDAAWAELETGDAVRSPGWALARGRVLGERGEHEASARELRRALGLARAEGDARTEAAAWLGLAEAETILGGAEAARGHDPERAGFYARMAAAARVADGESVGDEDGV